MDSNNSRITRRLGEWYTSTHRDLPWRRTDDPYAIWVSEVMLQQTQVKTVIPYYNAFLERFPTIGALAAADLSDVIKAWEGLGYYARVRNLHRACRRLVDDGLHHVPDASEAFRALPGVGEYVCAAVQSIAYGHPLAAVDGNVKRVVARLFALDEPVNRSSSAKTFARRAGELLDPDAPGRHNQAMMELGALICRPSNPECHRCPISGECAAFANGRQRELPRRDPRRATPSVHVAVGVVIDDGRLLITRRPEDGLLGGLWEFPGGKVSDGESAPAACAREIREEVGIDVEVGDFVGRVRHAYTHFKVELDVYRCRYRGGDITLDGPTDYRWIRLEEIDDYAFPKANHKFIPLLRESLDKK